jgi:hypothetical protein
LEALAIERFRLSGAAAIPPHRSLPPQDIDEKGGGLVSAEQRQHGPIAVERGIG